MNRMNVATVVSALALLAVSTAAQARLAVKETPAVDFFATGPGGLNMDGKTSDFTVQDDGKTATFTVALKNLNTGIALRDEHMKDKYLETSKYPDATLKVSRDQFKVPEIGKHSDGEAKGTFTLHGKSKDVTVKYKAKREKNGEIAADAKFAINLKDYEIAIPNYLGVTVKPDIDIQVKFQATDD